MSPLLERIAAEPFAVLATHGPDGRIDAVPCCFAVEAGEVVTAVDHKPKTTTALARLRNIARDPTVTLLVDGRDAHDWSALWWVRLHGRARVEELGTAGHAAAVAALVVKYAQYGDRPPVGPAIRVTPVRWSSWSAT